MIKPGIFHSLCKEARFAKGFNLSSVPCPTYSLSLFPLDFIILIISYFGCKETSNSHLGKNVSNIGEDFFSLLLLNNFRNVGQTISFSLYFYYISDTCRF